MAGGTLNRAIRLWAFALLRICQFALTLEGQSATLLRERASERRVGVRRQHGAERSVPVRRVVNVADAADPKLTATGPSIAAEVELLAARALGILASHKTGPSRPTDTRVRRISDHFIAEDPEQWHTALRKVMAKGITTSEVIAHILPEAARLLGQRWMDSEISFAEVSIGSARMQEAVRTLRIQDGFGGNVEAKVKVLFIVPRPEQHTLGVFVAADQMRRIGADVHFSIAPHPRQVAEIVRETRFSMIGLTVSGRRTLASVKELVAAIRGNTLVHTPLVIGGPITESTLDVKALTKVDHVINTTDEAARICGLSTTDLREDERPSSKERDGAKTI